MNNLIQWIQDNPQQVSAMVALMALCVSFLSILLTIWSLHLSRQHNFKSLTPIASIACSDYENKLAVKIINTGIGPLIISTFRATRGNETEDDLVSLMPALPKGMLWDTFFHDPDGACISPGEGLIILQLSGNSKDIGFGNARDACRKALAETTVDLTFKDIYGRQMSPVKKSLGWFGRHFERTEFVLAKKARRHTLEQKRKGDE
jgi:hypothetical protein